MNRDEGFGDFIEIAIPVLLDAVAVVAFVGMVGVWIIIAGSSI